MTAGQKDTWKPLQLLILLGLLFLSRELEVRGQEDESAALHHLRGTTGWEFPDRMKNPAEPSLITDQLLLHNDEDLFFWEHLEGQTMDACPPSVSHSFRQKLLVRTETLNKTVRQEYSADPLKPEPVSTKSPDTEACESEVKRNSEVKRFGSSSEDGLDGNKTTDIQEFLIHHLEAALERKQENHQLMDHPDSGSWYQSPQRAADPVPQFDHQQILLLQDDHVVQSAAAHLYNKHPSVSSVHVLDQNQRPKQVQGEPVPLSENSSLVLVGHGARDGSGQTRISGFTYRDVARIIQSCSRMGHRIRTTTVVACDVGSDEQFVEDLLKTLHEAGVQTELHLWRTVVQVTETGQIISQDMSPDGPQWRHEDSTKKVVVTVGRNGELRRTAESLWKGEAVFTNTTDFLVKTESPPKENKNQDVERTNKDKLTNEVNNNRQSSLQGGFIISRPSRQISPRFLKYRTSWPTQPRTFIDPEVYRTADEPLKQDLKELEGFTWGLFHADHPKPGKVGDNILTNKLNDFIMGERDEPNKCIGWIDDMQEKLKILQKCYEIKSGGDIRNIIRHFAKEGEDGTTYVMVNSWIFEVDPRSLYMYPVGKKLDNNQQNSEDSVKLVKDSIEAQICHEAYHRIKNGIKESLTNTGQPAVKVYAEYARNIFLGEHASIPPIKAEAWWTTFFVASVIAESSRNFRTFPLILMALDLTQNSDQNVQSKGEAFLFEDHSMTREGTWIDPSRRGFSGSATPQDSSKLTNVVAKTKEELMKALEGVIQREDTMFSNWKQSLQTDQTSRQMATIAKYYKTIDDEKDFIQACNDFWSTKRLNKRKPDEESEQRSPRKVQKTAQ